MKNYEQIREILIVAVIIALAFGLISESQKARECKANQPKGEIAACHIGCQTISPRTVKELYACYGQESCKIA
jgi:hypothetical protein